MAVPPVLIVSLEFDPPAIHFVGAVQPATLLKLNDLIPKLTSVGNSRHAAPQFVSYTTPLPRHFLEVRHQMTTEPTRMAMILAVLECLEDEGGWTMRDTHASLAVDSIECHKFFFTKSAR